MVFYIKHNGNYVHHIGSFKYDYIKIDFITCSQHHMAICAPFCFRCNVVEKNIIVKLLISSCLMLCAFRTVIDLLLAVGCNNPT